MIAAGPYLDGVRWQDQPDWQTEGMAELHATGEYSRTLALARAGVLPFFLLAILHVVAGPADLRPGPGARVGGGVVLVPPVLAHAGLATTDMAITGRCRSCCGRLRWLDEPDRRATLLLGPAAGVAVLPKFSALLFVPVAVVTMLVLKLLIEPVGPALSWRAAAAGARPGRCRRGVPGDLGRIPLSCGHPRLDPAGRLSLGDACPLGRACPDAAGARVLERTADPDLYNEHIPSYALGQVRDTGPWYFFPLALGVKAPLGFLVLAVPGLVVGLRWRGGTGAGFAVPAPVALALLAGAMRTTIAIGPTLAADLPAAGHSGGVGGASLWRMGGAPRRRRGAGILAARCLGAGASGLPGLLQRDRMLAPRALPAEERPGLRPGRRPAGRYAPGAGIDSVTVYFSPSRQPAPRRAALVDCPDWHHETPPPVTGWIAASMPADVRRAGNSVARGHRPAPRSADDRSVLCPARQRGERMSPRTTAGARMSIPC